MSQRRIFRFLLRLNSLWTGPILTVVLFIALFVVVPVAFGAPAGPGGTVTTGSCSFGTTWSDGMSRWIFGISVVLMLLGVVTGGLGMRSGGSGGGEVVGGAVGGLTAVAIVLGIIGLVGSFASIAITAAGGTPCA